jgi:hypothetical protein
VADADKDGSGQAMGLRVAHGRDRA